MTSRTRSIALLLVALLTLGPVAFAGKGGNGGGKPGGGGEDPPAADYTVVFVRDWTGGGVRALDPLTGAEAQVTSGVDAGPCFNPAGTRIAFERDLGGGSAAIVTASFPAGDGVTVLDTFPHDALWTWTDWMETAAGERIFYTVAPPEGGNRQLFAVSPDGTVKDRLTFDAGRYVSHPVALNDGTAVIALVDLHDVVKFDLGLVNGRLAVVNETSLRTAGGVLGAASLYDVDVSDDDRTVVVATGGTGDLFLIDVATKNATQLTATADDEQAPRYLGSSILAMHNERKDKLYWHDANTGAATAVPMSSRSAYHHACKSPWAE